MTEELQLRITKLPKQHDVKNLRNDTLINCKPRALLNKWKLLRNV